MWTCYVLANSVTGRTYRGMTRDLPRRLRQHNREIKGGARATARCAGGWRVALAVCGFRTRRVAMQVEWRLKHPPRCQAVHGGTARATRGLLSVLSAPDAQWISSVHSRAQDARLVVCGDSVLIDTLEDHVPVRVHRSLQFFRGDAVSLWLEIHSMPLRSHRA